MNTKRKISNSLFTFCSKHYSNLQYLIFIQKCVSSCSLTWQMKLQSPSYSNAVWFHIHYKNQKRTEKLTPQKWYLKITEIVAFIHNYHSFIWFDLVFVVLVFVVFFLCSDSALIRRFPIFRPSLCSYNPECFTHCGFRHHVPKLFKSTENSIWKHPGIKLERHGINKLNLTVTSLWSSGKET